MGGSDAPHAALEWLDGAVEACFRACLWLASWAVVAAVNVFGWYAGLSVGGVQLGGGGRIAVATAVKVGRNGVAVVCDEVSLTLRPAHPKPLLFRIRGVNVSADRCSVKHGAQSKEQPSSPADDPSPSDSPLHPTTLISYLIATTAVHVEDVAVEITAGAHGEASLRSSFTASIPLLALDLPETRSRPLTCLALSLRRGATASLQANQPGLPFSIHGCVDPVFLCLSPGDCAAVSNSPSGARAKPPAMSLPAVVSRLQQRDRSLAASWPPVFAANEAPLKASLRRDEAYPPAAAAGASIRLETGRRVFDAEKPGVELKDVSVVFEGVATVSVRGVAAAVKGPEEEGVETTVKGLAVAPGTPGSAYGLLDELDFSVAARPGSCDVACTTAAAVALHAPCLLQLLRLAQQTRRALSLFEQTAADPPSPAPRKLGTLLHTFTARLHGETGDPTKPGLTVLFPTCAHLPPAAAAVLRVQVAGGASVTTQSWTGGDTFSTAEVPGFCGVSYDSPGQAKPTQLLTEACRARCRLTVKQTAATGDVAAVVFFPERLRVALTPAVCHHLVYNVSFPLTALVSASPDDVLPLPFTLHDVPTRGPFVADSAEGGGYSGTAASVHFEPCAPRLLVRWGAGGEGGAKPVCFGLCPDASAAELSGDGAVLVLRTRTDPCVTAAVAALRLAFGAPRADEARELARRISQALGFHKNLAARTRAAAETRAAAAEPHPLPKTTASCLFSAGVAVALRDPDDEAWPGMDVELPGDPRLAAEASKYLLRYVDGEDETSVRLFPTAASEGDLAGALAPPVDAAPPPSPPGTRRPKKLPAALLGGGGGARDPECTLVQDPAAQGVDPLEDLAAQSVDPLEDPAPGALPQVASSLRGGESSVDCRGATVEWTQEKLSAATFGRHLGEGSLADVSLACGVRVAAATATLAVDRAGFPKDLDAVASFATFSLGSGVLEVRPAFLEGPGTTHPTRNVSTVVLQSLGSCTMDFKSDGEDRIRLDQTSGKIELGYTWNRSTVLWAPKHPRLGHCTLKDGVLLKPAAGGGKRKNEDEEEAEEEEDEEEAEDETDETPGILVEYEGWLSEEVTPKDVLDTFRNGDSDSERQAQCKIWGEQASAWLTERAQSNGTLGEEIFEPPLSVRPVTDCVATSRLDVRLVNLDVFAALFPLSDCYEYISWLFPAPPPPTDPYFSTLYHARWEAEAQFLAPGVHREQMPVFFTFSGGGIHVPAPEAKARWSPRRDASVCIENAKVHVRLVGSNAVDKSRLWKDAGEGLLDWGGAGAGGDARPVSKDDCVGAAVEFAVGLSGEWFDDDATGSRRPTALAVELRVNSLVKDADPWRLAPYVCCTAACRPGGSGAREEVEGSKLCLGRNAVVAAQRAAENNFAATAADAGAAPLPAKEPPMDWTGQPRPWLVSAFHPGGLTLDLADALSRPRRGDRRKPQADFVLFANEPAGTPLDPAVFPDLSAKLPDDFAVLYTGYNAPQNRSKVEAQTGESVRLLADVQGEDRLAVDVRNFRAVYDTRLLTAGRRESAGECPVAQDVGFFACRKKDGEECPVIGWDAGVLCEVGKEAGKRVRAAKRGMFQTDFDGENSGDDGESSSDASDDDITDGQNGRKMHVIALSDGADTVDAAMTKTVSPPHQIMTADPNRWTPIEQRDTPSNTTTRPPFRASAASHVPKHRRRLPLPLDFIPPCDTCPPCILFTKKRKLIVDAPFTVAPPPPYQKLRVFLMGKCLVLGEGASLVFSQGITIVSLRDHPRGKGSMEGPGGGEDGVQRHCRMLGGRVVVGEGVEYEEICSRKEAEAMVCGCGGGESGAGDRAQGAGGSSWRFAVPMVESVGAFSVPVKRMPAFGQHDGRAQDTRVCVNLAVRASLLSTDIGAADHMPRTDPSATPNTHHVNVPLVRLSTYTLPAKPYAPVFTVAHGAPFLFKTGVPPFSIVLSGALSPLVVAAPADVSVTVRPCDLVLCAGAARIFSEAFADASAIAAHYQAEQPTSPLDFGAGDSDSVGGSPSFSESGDSPGGFPSMPPKRPRDLDEPTAPGVMLGGVAWTGFGVWQLALAYDSGEVLLRSAVRIDAGGGAAAEDEGPGCLDKSIRVGSLRMNNKSFGPKPPAAGAASGDAGVQTVVVTLEARYWNNAWEPLLSKASLKLCLAGRAVSVGAVDDVDVTLSPVFFSKVARYLLSASSSRRPRGLTPAQCFNTPRGESPPGVGCKPSLLLVNATGVAGTVVFKRENGSSESRDLPAHGELPVPSDCEAALASDVAGQPARAIPVFGRLPAPVRWNNTLVVVEHDEAIEPAVGSHLPNLDFSLHARPGAGDPASQFVRKAVIRSRVVVRNLCPASIWIGDASDRPPTEVPGKARGSLPLSACGSLRTGLAIKASGGGLSPMFCVYDVLLCTHKSLRAQRADGAKPVFGRAGLNKMLDSGVYWVALGDTSSGGASDHPGSPECLMLGVELKAGDVILVVMPAILLRNHLPVPLKARLVVCSESGVPKEHLPIVVLKPGESDACTVSPEYDVEVWAEPLSGFDTPKGNRVVVHSLKLGVKPATHVIKSKCKAKDCTVDLLCDSEVSLWSGQQPKKQPAPAPHAGHRGKGPHSPAADLLAAFDWPASDRPAPLQSGQLAAVSASNSGAAKKPVCQSVCEPAPLFTEEEGKLEQAGCHGFRVVTFYVKYWVVNASAFPSLFVASSGGEEEGVPAARGEVVMWNEDRGGSTEIAVSVPGRKTGRRDNGWSAALAIDVPPAANTTIACPGAPVGRASCNHYLGADITPAGGVFAHRTRVVRLTPAYAIKNGFSEHYALTLLTGGAPVAALGPGESVDDFTVPASWGSAGQALAQCHLRAVYTDPDTAAETVYASSGFSPQTLGNVAVKLRTAGAAGGGPPDILTVNCRTSSERSTVHILFEPGALPSLRVVVQTFRPVFIASVGPDDSGHEKTYPKERLTPFSSVPHFHDVSGVTHADRKVELTVGARANERGQAKETTAMLALIPTSAFVPVPGTGLVSRLLQGKTGPVLVLIEPELLLDDSDEYCDSDGEDDDPNTERQGSRRKQQQQQQQPAVVVSVPRVGVSCMLGSGDVDRRELAYFAMKDIVVCAKRRADDKYDAAVSFGAFRLTNCMERAVFRTILASGHASAKLSAQEKEELARVRTFFICSAAGLSSTTTASARYFKAASVSLALRELTLSVDDYFVYQCYVFARPLLAFSDGGVCTVSGHAADLAAAGAPGMFALAPSNNVAAAGGVPGGLRTRHLASSLARATRKGRTLVDATRRGVLADTVAGGEFLEESMRRKRVLAERRVAAGDVSSKFGHPDYITARRIDVHPLKVYLTFESTGLVTEDKLLYLNRARSVRDVAVEVPAVSLVHVFSPASDAVAVLGLHYSTISWQLIYRLLLSLEFLGNPVGLLGNIGGGLSDLFYEPASAFGKENANVVDVVASLGKGATSLAGGFAYGVSSTASSITSSLGKGVAALSFDDEYLYQRKCAQALPKPRPINIGEGFLDGATQFAAGIGEGLTGIVRKPMEGACERGLSGLISGVGIGLVGAFVKPVTGAIDFAARTTEGAKNMVVDTDAPADGLSRPPRVAVVALPLLPYNPLFSQLMAFHQAYRRGKYLGERMIGCYAGPHLALLLTNRRLAAYEVTQRRRQSTGDQTVSVAPSDPSAAEDASFFAQSAEPQTADLIRPPFASGIRRVHNSPAAGGGAAALAVAKKKLWGSKYGKLEAVTLFLEAGTLRLSFCPPDKPSRDVALEASTADGARQQAQLIFGVLLDVRPDLILKEESFSLHSVSSSGAR
ncbi:putative vacuolar protein sorting-associated protein 13A [Diplonema papillatum]|nr:putative vacuolar protein sorting-associated protein 13A [Diplonema papillatum]